MTNTAAYYNYGRKMFYSRGPRTPFQEENVHLGFMLVTCGRCYKRFTGVTYGRSKARWVSYEHCAAACNTAYGHYILCHGFRLGKLFGYEIVS